LVRHQLAQLEHLDQQDQQVLRQTLLDQQAASAQQVRQDQLVQLVTSAQQVQLECKALALQVQLEQLLQLLVQRDLQGLLVTLVQQAQLAHLSQDLQDLLVTRGQQVQRDLLVMLVQQGQPVQPALQVQHQTSQDRPVQLDQLVSTSVVHGLHLNHIHRTMQ
jgi:hypothetical protein